MDEVDSSLGASDLCFLPVVLSVSSYFTVRHLISKVNLEFAGIPGIDFFP